MTRLVLPLCLLAGLAARAPAQPASTRPAAPPPATTGPAATAPAAAIPCPVTGRPIDRNVVTRFRNRWVYFADTAALQTFEADPYEYADQVQRQWALDRPLRVQVRCPVTGRPIDPQIYDGHGETAVFFATAAARDEYRSDPARFAAKLDQAFTFQTGCGTCDGDILPDVSLLDDGRTLYFCCRGCRAAFEKDPAAYRSKILARIAANETAWRARHSAPSTAPAPAADASSDRPARP